MFKKKCISIFISFSLFVSMAVSVSGNNRQTLHSNEYYIKENIISKDNANNNSLNISSKSAVLIENNNGRILYSKNKDKEMIPASITKIMTLNLIFDALESGKIKLDDEVSTSEYAASMGGSQVFLEPGEIQTVDTMIKCISISSANDAAVSMAEYIAGSETDFVKMMNKKAHKLGMKHSNFKNCNGLDDSIKSGHFSSAYDVALMSRELITKHPQISKYSTTWMDTITHKTRKGEKEFGLTNTNKLIRTYNGITGLKTGSTSKAKYCLSATAKRNGISLTAVVMAAPDPKKRFSEAASLLDYGFSLCKNYSKIIPETLKINGGKKNEIKLKTLEDFKYILVNNESSDKISRKVYLKKTVNAPLKNNEKVGKIVYLLDDKKIKEIPIYTSEAIAKSSFFDYMLLLIKKLV